MNDANRPPGSPDEERAAIEAEWKQAAAAGRTASIIGWFRATLGNSAATVGCLGVALVRERKR
jgi:hypothetical protein